MTRRAKTTANAKYGDAAAEDMCERFDDLLLSL